jgi:hypothetical protein
MPLPNKTGAGASFFIFCFLSLGVHNIYCAQNTGHDIEPADLSLEQKVGQLFMIAIDRGAKVIQKGGP